VTGANLGYPGDVSIEIPAHIIIVREDECSIWTEPKCYDIFGILPSIALEVFYFAFPLSNQILFIYTRVSTETRKLIRAI